MKYKTIYFSRYVLYFNNRDINILNLQNDFGVFLLASFGSSMVLLYGYPESPFAQPKNVFWTPDYFYRWLNCFTLYAIASLL